MTLSNAANVALGVGKEAHDLPVSAAVMRAVLVYVVTLAIVRLGKKRFMSRATAFDVIVGIVLGSIVSRAVTANAPLLPALAAAATIMAMHWAFSATALWSRTFGRLIKGCSRLLIKDGVVDEAAARSEHMTPSDIAEALRGHGVSDASTVREACIERSGAVSVISEGK